LRVDDGEPGGVSGVESGDFVASSRSAQLRLNFCPNAHCRYFPLSFIVVIGIDLAVALGIESWCFEIIGAPLALIPRSSSPSPTTLSEWSGTQDQVALSTTLTPLSMMLCLRFGAPRLCLASILRVTNDGKWHRQAFDHRHRLVPTVNLDLHCPKTSSCLSDIACASTLSWTLFLFDVSPTIAIP
jgi:hypothetical protein